MLDRTAIYPASHYVTRRRTIEEMAPLIREEMTEQVAKFREEGRLLEAQRIETRTNFDLEMMLEMGTCPGIENYSRYTSGRRPGRTARVPAGLLPGGLAAHRRRVPCDRFPRSTGCTRVIGRARSPSSSTGFACPSAVDNRPLTFDEWSSLLNQVLFVSATPGDYELELCGGVVTEQIIRPTGLVDPPIDVRPVRGQVDDLLAEIRERAARDERVLVTTLTKRMAEDLSEYLQSVGVRVRYMHADIDTIERMEILRTLRLGRIDVLVGINLLRRGLGKRLGSVRNGFGRAGLAAAALLAVAVIVVGCEVPLQSRDSAPPSFAHLPPLVFDLERIEVGERGAAPHPSDVDHLFPTPPAIGARIWAEDRLRASGHVGVLRVTIEEASARATPLATNKNLEGLLTEEQAERIDLRLRVTIDAIDESGQVNGSATATAVRSRTLPEGITLAERERHYDEIVAALLYDYNASQEAAIRKYLGLYLR